MARVISWNIRRSVDIVEYYLSKAKRIVRTRWPRNLLANVPMAT